MNIVDNHSTTEESIKDMLNREYGFYFKRDHFINIYKESRPTFTVPF